MKASIRTRVRSWLRGKQNDSGVIPRPAVAAPRTDDDAAIADYVSGGRIPWSNGYWQYRQKFLKQTLADVELMARFRRGQALPPGYGARLDERVIEYPWILSRLPSSSSQALLDAGACLVFPFILKQPQLKGRPLVVYNLEYEPWMKDREETTLIIGDLRTSALRDKSLHAIVCLSTLEHIGMDNTRHYTANRARAEARPDDYRLALHEFRRMLAPGGQAFITVPFGVYQDLGWIQQFDSQLVDDVAQTFGGQVLDRAFYRYQAEGWQVATEADAAEAVYFDVHVASGPAHDGAAAARAVACLHLAAP